MVIDMQYRGGCMICSYAVDKRLSSYNDLNLTQLLMQNSHCLLLSSFIPLPKNGNEIFHSPSQKFSFLFPFSKSKSHSCSPLLGRRLSTLNNI